MTVADPETGTLEHRQDDPAVVSAAADQLNDATVAVEAIDYNALTDDQLRAVLRAKSTLSDVCRGLRHRRQRQERKDGGRDA